MGLKPSAAHLWCRPRLRTQPATPSLQFLTTADPETVTEVLDLTFVEGDFSGLTDATTIVDEGTAQLADLQVGDDITLRFATGEASLEVSGLYEAEGFWSGFVITDTALQDGGRRRWRFLCLREGE